MSIDKYVAERGIIAHRPGEPFVLVENVAGDTIADLSALEWQASTVPPTWRDVQSWSAQGVSGDSASYADELARQRNAWLDVCQIIFDEVQSPGTHDLPPDMTTPIAKYSQAWIAWRQEMRDITGLLGLDAKGLVEEMRPVRTTMVETWPTTWPTPPIAPIRTLNY